MSHRVIYSSPFVPAEWIAAHGLYPVRLVPDRLPTPAPEGCCPYAASFAAAALAPDAASGVIVTTTCDQMRRMAEQMGRQSTLPLFTMNVPATWQTPTAQRMYLDEIRRLGGFLVALGGISPAPSHLATVMREHDAARAAHRAGGDSSAANDALRGKSQGDCRGIPIAIVGGPLRRADCIIYDLIEQAGGRIVLDATETGERTRPAPFDRRRLAEDPLLELAETYNRIPDVFRRPNSLLYEYLRQQMADGAVRGIVLVRCVWCDLWHAEAQRLREWAGLPLVEVDLSGEEGDRERTRTRIESLLEALR